MFGTFIMDTYKRDEIAEIVDALDMLCSPNDSYGWASAGIYSFWNYYTRDILYIGLAVDFSTRFKQHNGIIPTDPRSCKIQRINAYFEENEKLGYSILVRSPLDQPVIAKNIYDWFGFDPDATTLQEFTYERSKNDLKRIEGNLIEAYRQHQSRLPVWNRIDGQQVGKRSATKNQYNLVDCFSKGDQIIKGVTKWIPERVTANLISRSSLRELAENPTFERYENYLHTLRMINLHFPGENTPSLASWWSLISQSDPQTLQDIMSNRYFEKVLIL
ncbi:GIY-YIG nuclease family protein [Alicyclobacillus fastidiosus]|uniref:GIY-YIG nuclease family protein n=1 Tax=Alicyclobacillus fastidiosus TaxID=392011 RepID=A0ABV5AJ69_9BACL|nr:GIY-YIG nuclease family protein [Alicyclobacillus fastidiosus]WEH09123.1 GIY-YIG nuclease family protein [Alicyclobacillus fastidiosus]